MSSKLRNNWVASAVRMAPWAIALGMGGFAAYGLLGSGWAVQLAVVKELLPAVAGISGVFVGFAGTSKSILLAISSSSPVISHLKENQGYGHLIRHFFDTAILGLLSAVLSVVGLAFDWNAPSYGGLAFVSVWAGAVSGTLVAVYLTTWYLFKVLDTEGATSVSKATPSKPVPQSSLSTEPDRM